MAILISAGRVPGGFGDLWVREALCQHAALKQTFKSVQNKTIQDPQER